MENKEIIQNPIAENSTEGVKHISKDLKIVTMTVLIGLILATVYMTFRIATSSGVTPIFNSDNEPASSAYFTPGQPNAPQDLNGRISRTSGIGTDSDYSFELQDTGGKRLAYIYSDAHSLELYLGLDVKLNAEYIRKASDGSNVLFVHTIEWDRVN